MRDLRRQRGYTLTELLVVLAIIGAISLVTVPAFMSYRESAKIKSSLRQLTSDIRGTRHRAIARNRPVKLSFTPTSNGAPYRFFDGDTAGTTWTLVGPPKSIDPAIWVETTTFEDEDTVADGMCDIIFRPDGTISPLKQKTEGGKLVSLLTLRTKAKIPMNEYTIYFQPNGSVKAVGSKY